MAEIEISAMTFGAFGVGRVGGKAVMVPGAVVGDRLDVEVVSERRDYSVAKIREVVRASAERRVAPCPYLPRCGGCDWQHVEFQAQVRFKGEVVARELGHALGVEIDSCMVAEAGMRMPAHLARSLGKRVEEIEVVRDGAREVQVAHLKKPPTEEELRRAGNVLEADGEIAGIVLRASASRATVGDATISIELEDGLS